MARSALPLNVTAAALADAELRLSHAQDGAATVLVWQVGVLVLYAGFGALLGHRLMRRRVGAPSVSRR